MYSLRPRIVLSISWAILSVCSAAVMSAAAKPYEPPANVAGKLSSVGSDTLANLMTLWAEAFREQHPAVSVQIQAAGSSTAPPALVEGASNFGPMSRAMKEGEIRAFRERFGYEPTRISVAIDALAVFVHRSNPVAKTGMSLQEVDAIFSRTRSCGANEDVLRWGQIDSLEKNRRWRGRSIQLFGRNSVSGTYGYFKKVALCKGDFKSQVNEQPGSASVVQSVASSRNAVGYSGLGYVTAGVVAVPVSEEPGQPVVAPTAQSAASGDYPLARHLYIYVNQRPGQKLGALQSAFLTFVLSDEGQAIVAKDGYVPLPPSVRTQMLTVLE